MGTHYHLLVDSRREQMSHALHRLNGMYAQRFNRRHARRGHLFEDRFAAWVIRDDEHLSATIAYILENPLRAGLCSDPRDWMWSGRRVPQRLPSSGSAATVPATPGGLSPGQGC
jgi:REP element-mobilizing transposase RayT